MKRWTFIEKLTKNQQNWRIKHLRTKLFAGFLVILLIMAGLGTLSIVNLQSSNKKIEKMISSDIEILAASENYIRNISERIAAVRGYLAHEGSSIYKTKFEQLTEDGNELGDQLLTISKGTNNEKTIQDLIAQTNEWSKQIEETVIANYSKFSGNLTEARQLLEKAEPQSVIIMREFEELSDENQTNMEKAGNTLLQNAKKVQQTIIIIIITALILGVIIALYATNIIVKPIVQVVGKLGQIAKGDLSGEQLNTNSKDEIGTLVSATNSMVDSLRNLVTKVNQSSEQIAASAEELTASSEQTSNATQQIADTSEQMATGAEQQLNSVNETAATIQQISTGIQQIAANSESVSTFASGASSSCKDGVSTVDEVVEQMNAIEKTVTETAENIQSLGERSKEIDKIVTIITDISDQTNLLALNAAIEAARAGEAGKGFAVVADEVRKLSEQSAGSAKQITDLIQAIQEETITAVESMKNGTAKTKDGLMKTSELSRVFQTIEESVEKVEVKVQDVSAATEQMATGSNQMVNAIETVKQAAEEHASSSQDNSAASQEQLAMMEEIASSAQSLEELAEEMRDMVKLFKL